MKKPQLCFALSVSLTLAQIPMLPGLAAPASGNIWQKMSSSKTVAAQPAKAKTVAVKAKQAAKPIVQAQQPVAADGQAMLFLLKGKGASASAPAPGAALTIHPQVADTPAVAAETTAPASDLVAGIPETKAPEAVEERNEIPTPGMSNDAPQVTGGNILSQISPDALVAQGTDAPIVATPIPPVVTGTIDMEEFKSTNIIDLKVSQSRTFKSRNKIVRTSISDPSIAEPVVVAENQIVLLGKSPGGATMVLWDDAGNSIAVDLRVSRDYSQLQATLREIDPRIVVKAFSVGGSDRTLLLGDVDHAESIIRAFMAANAFMDDRGMIIQVANSRLINARVGEQGVAGGGGAGGQTGQLAQLSSVDKYTFFSNVNNNISRAQYITSDGGRVTSFVKVRKNPLIVLHCSFMEMNSTAARALAIQLGVTGSTNTFAFGVGGGANPQTNQNTIFSNPGVTTTIVTSSPVNGVGAAQQAYAVSPVFFGSGTLVGNPYTGTGSPLNNFGTNGIGQGLLNGVPTLLQQAVLLGSPGSTSFSQAINGLANLFQGISNFPTNQKSRFGLNPTVQGVITQTRARVLTEPTLVTISGERAAFLAGGEIPILQSIATAGTSQFSVTFEPFGIRLNMIPVLMENGNINLEVSPEERLISNQPGLALQFLGGQGSIPAFTTRKAQTIVEMKPGQELFISGMISANTGRQISKTPLIGEVPVLGALYRSKAFTKKRKRTRSCSASGSHPSWNTWTTQTS
jgi:Flp pilus assembly secretin CpaC